MLLRAYVLALILKFGKYAWKSLITAAIFEFYCIVKLKDDKNSV